MSMRITRLFGALAVSGLALGVAIGVAHAGPGGSARGVVLKSDVPPEVYSFGNVLDADKMDEVTQYTERMAPYLVVGADGQVSLKPATAAQIGVPDWFLANYRIALESSNRVIASGDIKVNADLTVEVLRKEPAGFDVKRDNAGVVVDGAGQPDSAVPEWYVWRYNTGCIYYNSYDNYNTYRSNYYNLCNSMASYSGYPWMSSNLVYFYSYNQNYLSNSCYNPNGVYYYLPYQSGCQSSYNPCYGGLGYKPAYFWTRSYSYNNSCRCYSNQYSWQGYWGRY